MPTFYTFFRHLKQSPWYIVFICVFFVNAMLSTFFSIGILGSFHFYTNISSSMDPTIKRGDLAIVLSKNMNTYKVGDIVTYHAEIDGRDEIVTHRIHAIGGNVYITKGDNNRYPDDTVLRPRLIIGSVISVIPQLGFWVMFLKSLFGRLLFIVIPMIVIIVTELIEILPNRTSKR